MKTILLFLALIPFASFCQSDTVKVWLTRADCKSNSIPYPTESPKPYRRVDCTVPVVPLKGNNGGGCVVDSIRVCNQAIKADTSQYYLIVYSVDSVKVFEGDFFGHLSNGIIIEYDRYGRKVFDGQTELRYNRRNDPYTYRIGTNRTYTYKNRNSTIPKSIVEIVYLSNSKKYIRRVYGADGKVITESKGKR